MAPMVAFRRRLLGMLVSAATLAAVMPIAGLAAPDDPVLPDLVADAPERQQIANYTYPDGTQALLLRFDGYVHNIGPGPFEIRTTDRVGTEYTNVRQYVRTVGGGMVAVQPPPGPPEVKYETEDGHNHWHLQEIARYSLWNSAKTAEVAPGMKAGFCLIDSARVEGTGPATAVYQLGDFCGRNLPTKPGVTMGVSAGWRDIYNRELSFQWVDISDVRPGNYWLAAEIDTNGVIKEASESNNTRAFAAGQSVVPGYVATAVNAGTIPFGTASTVNLASTTFGAPGARRFRIESLPEHGTLSAGTTALAVGSVVTGPGITFTPASGYSGPDTFTFAAFDATSAFPKTPPAASVSLNVGAQTAAQVAVSGAPETLDLGASAQLAATVINAAPGVTWTVDGVSGGDARIGTVSATGLYRAPDALPDPVTVTIRATSTASPAAFGEASIRLTDPGSPDPAPQPPTNLVTNPSFETSTDDWSSYQAGITRTQLADAPDGVWVAKVTRTTGTSFAVGDGPVTVPSASTATPYSGRAFVKAASSSSVGRTVRLYLREATPGASGRYIRTVEGPAVTLTNGFQDLTATITAQADGNEIDFYVAQSGATTGDAFYIDQVSLAASSSPTPGNTAPTASFTATPANPAIGQSVSFTDTSTDSDGTIALREWDLDGNGSFETTGANPSRSYAASGDVTVTLRVTDDGGAPATTTKVVSVQAAPPPNTAPTASFTATPANPAIGQSVSFTDTSTDSDGTIAGREWDLDGDGQFDDSTIASPTATYAAAGPVTVGLRVTDDGGATATATQALTVSAAPPPPPPPTSCAPGEFTAEYFANRDLSGPPVLTRCETEIANDWGTGSPAAQVPSDDFSARWTRSEDFAAGDWRFSTLSDDGVRLFVDGAPVIDNWTDHAPQTDSALTTLAAGPHEVVVEYYENGVGAVAEASWALQTPPPPPTSCAPGEFTAEYFANRDLSGPPVLTRCETEIANDWGTGSPAAQVPSDDFSARWTRSEDFAAGDWRFSTLSDDGVRLFVDGAPVIDNWTDHAPQTDSALTTLAAGPHEVVVEYYENGVGAVAEASWALQTPPPPPTSCAPGEFTAEYFANRDLSGPPVLTRCETEIANDWGTGSPAAQVPSDDFSARWTRSEDFAAGDWRFSTLSDDGVRLFVDGAPVIDNWTDHAPQTDSALTTLAAGPHEVVVEYYENGVGAVAEASWALQTPPPPPTSCAPGEFTAEYFANRDLSGPPVLTRCETEIANDWGTGSPAAQVPSDDFSARWTRSEDFAAGDWRFSTLSDDGVRLFVDGAPVIDNWTDHAPQTDSALTTLAAGPHEVVVEYYENGVGAVAEASWALQTPVPGL